MSQSPSAIPGSHDPAGTPARGVRRRGADRPRGQPDEHEGRRHRRRRDDDPGTPGADGLAADELRQAHELLSPADPPAQPDAQHRDHGQPDGARRRPRRRHGPPQWRRPPAPRDPDHRQGQHQHDRHADDRRLVGARGQHARRRVHRRPAQGRGRDHHRQGQPQRVGELPVRPVVVGLERHRRPDQHALRPRPQPVRLELRARASSRRPTSRSRRSARRRTARSSARRARTASSASSRRSACGAAPASSRSAPTRTPPARWPAT